MCPQEMVFSNCDALRLIMGTVMKDLHLQEACPSELCSISQFTWWLRLQLTNKTMRSALHQLPLCISFSDVWRVNPVPSSKHDSQAWELLLLCCTYPIATLRLHPNPNWESDSVLAEPRFQRLQGVHLRHVSGLHWVARHTNPDAEPLSSFPNLESLEFEGDYRQSELLPPHSPWNIASLQHLQAVTLKGVQCHADTLAAALPRVPLDRLTLDECSVSFQGQQADDRAIRLQDKCWDGVHVRHLHLQSECDVAVKLFEHCETVTLFLDDLYRLDLGPDHLPSPSVFLRLLKGTRLRQLKLVDPARGLNPAVTLVGGWGSANEKGSRWPPECYCSMDAGRLYATANAQGLSATFETGPWAMCSPNVLTLSWPDRS